VPAWRITKYRSLAVAAQLARRTAGGVGRAIRDAVAWARRIGIQNEAPARRRGFVIAYSRTTHSLCAQFNRATSYSPTHLARAVPSGLRGLTAVFGMGTGVTPSLESPKAEGDRRQESSVSLNIDGPPLDKLKLVATLYPQ
jgi:hypothetical protein